MITQSDVFRGHYHHNLESKGRLSIPIRFRKILDHVGNKTLFLITSDECLVAYPESEWSRIVKTLPKTSSLQSDAGGSVLPTAVECPIDAQGRIFVPLELRRAAGIVSKVVLLSLLTRFEIWSRERWDVFGKHPEATFEKIADQLSSLEGQA